MRALKLEEKKKTIFKGNNSQLVRKYTALATARHGLYKTSLEILQACL